jgi:Tol biopolymer transport system component
MRRGVWVLAALVALALPPQTQAAFPGQNGKIAYSRGSDIWAMNADGSAQTNVTNTSGSGEGAAAWSPDGSKIAFIRPDSVWSMNADGTAQTNLTASYVPPCPSCEVVAPTGVDWSPDGIRLAFTNDNRACDDSIAAVAAVDADGTDVMPITCGGAVDNRIWSSPSWSSDGKLIAFTGPHIADDSEIWTVGPDGSGLATVAADPSERERYGVDWSPDASKLVFMDIERFVPAPHLRMYTVNRNGTGITEIPGTVDVTDWPAWSPDGSKIVFEKNGDIQTMNPDGTGVVNLTNTPTIIEGAPDWQPIPINSYPRPKGATPFYGSLATAYKPCTAPNRTHGPPLVYGSCSNLQMTSDYLTVGTGDSNQRPARNEGHLRLGVMPGNPATPADEADVALEFFSDDIFTKAFADYTGELRAKVLLQITDKDNTPNPSGPGAATTTQIPLELTVGCTPVADPQEGSACTANTSADALAPGTVKEGRRSIWGLGRVEVYDGGADGDAQTPAGDTLFATQGVFIP